MEIFYAMEICKHIFIQIITLIILIAWCDISTYAGNEDINVYFRDEYLVISWNDDTIATLNIVVENTDNQNIIQQTSVDSGYYAAEIPENVKQISVDVEILSSKTEVISDNHYIFDVPKFPKDVTITYPQTAYLNHRDMTVFVTTGEEYSFKGYDNETLIYESYYNPPGEYEITLYTLDEPLHNIAMYVIDKNGNMFSRRAIFILDLEPPELTLDGDYDGLSTTFDSGMLEGKVDKDAKLTINGDRVIPQKDGKFEYKFDLENGENLFEIKAKDYAGNTSEKTITMTRVDYKKDNVKLAIKAVLVLVAVLLGIIAIKLTAKRRADNNIYDKRIDDKKVKRALIIAVIYVLVGAVCYYLIAIVLMYSDCMAPTISKGAFVIGNRIAYRCNAPERGDIITLGMHGNISCNRVIGVGGDTIQFANGDAYINGTLLDEEYLRFDVDTNASDTFIVPEGTVFVLCDNREATMEDSRYWTKHYVDIEDIESKVVYIFNWKKLFIKDDGKQESEKKAPIRTFKIGDSAACDVLSTEREFTRTTITLDEIITGKKATDFINTSLGENVEPKEGTQFVVARYSSSIVNPKEVYIDLKVLGPDGNNLNNNGCEYTSKCYDIYSYITEDGRGCNNIYAYYEILVDTEEYLLKFGMKWWEDNGDYEDIQTANFLITME